MAVQLSSADSPFQRVQSNHAGILRVGVLSVRSSHHHLPWVTAMEVQGTHRLKYTQLVRALLLLLLAANLKVVKSLQYFMCADDRTSRKLRPPARTGPRRRHGNSNPLTDRNAAKRDCTDSCFVTAEGAVRFREESHASRAMTDLASSAAVRMKAASARKKPLSKPKVTKMLKAPRAPSKVHAGICFFIYTF